MPRTTATSRKMGSVPCVPTFCQALSVKMRLEYMDFVLELPQVSCEGFQLTFDQMLGSL